MICIELTKRVKNLFGHRYTTQILDYLNKKKILNDKGEPYSRGYITHVVNGVRENKKIENAIIELCSLKIENDKNVSLKKEKILSKNI